MTNFSISVRRVLASSLAILGGISLVSSTALGAPRCELTQTSQAGFVLSSDLLDEVAIVAGDVRHLELVSRINDLTGDAVREVLSFDNGNRISIRNGVTLAEIALGAFPFSLPTGAVPTQMGLIGDLQLDGSEEIGISVRYIGAHSGQSAFVFNGATKALLQSFPDVIVGLPQKQNPDEPNYPNSPPVSRMGVSAQVASIAGGRQIVYIDPHVNSGTVVFKTMCLIVDYQTPCYDIRTLHSSNVVPHNLGVKAEGFEATAGGPRTILLSDPSSDSLPITLEGVTDVRKDFAGAIVKFNGETLSVISRGDRPNGRRGFDLALASGNLIGQRTALVTATTDGISANDTAEFFLLGSSSGSILRRYTPQLSEENVDLGYSIDGGEDLTGDGVADVVVSAPGERNEGRVRIYTPGSDYFNRMILRVDDASIRFGHSIALVAPGRLVVADGAGNLYALLVSGEELGGTAATVCAPPQVPVPPTPGVEVNNTELIELRRNASSVSSLIGGLKYQRGRNRHNKEILKSIKRKTDNINRLLLSPTVMVRDSRFTDSYRRDVAKRAKALQSRYKKGSGRERRDAQKRLTAKTNQIVQISSAAIRR